MTKASIKNDFIASFIVFLVAIPLCLGIALASGANFSSGIIAGIIGGIVVGLISDSPVSVSGPAAGMVAIVLSSIAALGSFNTFLLALIFAGILQILIGLFRGGFIAHYVPSSVVQGLLAAIGILIIIKQLPLAFGVTTMPPTIFDIETLRKVSHFINIPATGITLGAIFILIAWNKLFPKVNDKIPAPIVAVIAAVGANFIFSTFFPSLALPRSLLVNIPSEGGIASALTHIPHPNLSQWSNLNVYLYGAIIAIIASLETLLNLEAAEKIDPLRRTASRNRELVAQGVGNSLSGLLGGLAITSVIVRTSVNIHSKNSSKLSTILHGSLILLSTLLVPSWLNQIPLSALAAILIVTGYKLTCVSLFKRMYRLGKAYFATFIITVIAIIFTNLLVGVLIGIGLSLFTILWYNSRHPLHHVSEAGTQGKVLRLVLPQQISFLNKPKVISALKKIPHNSQLIIDASNTHYMDQDIIELIMDFKRFDAQDKNIQLDIINRSFA